MGGLTLSQKEQARLKVLNGVLERRMNVEEAARVLGLSERHTWRILAAYQKEGAAALAHGNRGRRPANAIPASMRKQVIDLAKTTYQGFNHSHMTEALAEETGIVLSRGTVRNILVNTGIPSPRSRQPSRHRVRRERCPQEGMLLQLDGSFHDWLEGRGPWLTLLLAVDDATGRVPHALFREHEDTYGYLLLMENILLKQGIPLAVYHDCHAVFRARNQRRGQPAESSEKTQVSRAWEELGVCQIFAKSPQGKGRVERTAETFQDRLASELRRAGAQNMAEANQVLQTFLPQFNARFAVAARNPESAYRTMSPDLELETILCFKHRRKVARDNTVKYQWRTLQLLPEPGEPSRAGIHVEVQERLDGRLVVYHRGQMLPTQEAPPRASILREQGVSTESGHQVEKGLQAIPDAVRTAREEHDRYRTARRPRHHHTPTQRQLARWDAIRDAKEQGFSDRKIARVLGFSRNTVRKYIDAHGPPARSVSKSTYDELSHATDIVAYQ